MLKTSTHLAAMMTFALATGSAFADGHLNGDPTNGEKVFKKCAACHAVGEGAKSKVGPPLTDVVGRKAASFEGYKYGKSILAASEAGLVWTPSESPSAPSPTSHS